ncbi:MAG: type VI secretion system baseplate subunit TssK [Rhodocyclaceae bacterium]|nr:type VI secretion system baseplate subunit TssK [Rhodocyclaceae bacterium]
MSEQDKVLWSDGLFLRPQHFQQQERYFESLLDRRLGVALAYAYGFASLRIDRALLNLGKVALAQASGQFQDGTPFQVPHDKAAPDPLDVPDTCRDAIVALVLPLRRPGLPDQAFQTGADPGPVRYLAEDQEVRDAIAQNDSQAVLKIGRPNLRIMLKTDAGSGFNSLGFARILEKRSDGRVVLDEEYIPPALDCGISDKLRGWLREITGLLRQRAQALAERVSRPGSKGVADFADFLLLQLCNRYDPLFAHLSQRMPLHAELFYSYALEMAGELATFGRKDRRSAEFPRYDHDDLQASFAPVLDQLRAALTAVLEQTAVAIPLQDRGKGVYIGAVHDLTLLRGASFVVAVNADMPAEQIRQHFPSQVKIGPVEKIRDLVMRHLPGIVVSPLPVAPRQIPFHAGYSYFELDRKSEFWRGVEVSRVVALHIAGDFPNLQLEMWAIRD